MCDDEINQEQGANGICSTENIFDSNYLIVMLHRYSIILLFSKIA